MSASDELFQLILGRTTTKAVERILAAGYSKPRTISTVEELEGLAFESVIRDAGGFILERWGDEDAKLWAGVMRKAFIPRGDITLPATVLYTPKESRCTSRTCTLVGLSAISPSST